MVGPSVPVAFGFFCSELFRGASPADGELKAQIPWLRVFVDGVVIVGKVEATWARAVRLA